MKEDLKMRYFGYLSSGCIIPMYLSDRVILCIGSLLGYLGFRFVLGDILGLNVPSVIPKILLYIAIAAFITCITFIIEWPIAIFATEYLLLGIGGAISFLLLFVFAVGFIINFKYVESIDDENYYLAKSIYDKGDTIVVKDDVTGYSDLEVVTESFWEDASNHYTFESGHTMDDSVVGSDIKGAVTKKGPLWRVRAVIGHLSKFFVGIMPKNWGF